MHLLIALPIALSRSRPISVQCPNIPLIEGSAFSDGRGKRCADASNIYSTTIQRQRQLFCMGALIALLLTLLVSNFVTI